MAVSAKEETASADYRPGNDKSSSGDVVYAYKCDPVSGLSLLKVTPEDLLSNQAEAVETTYLSW